MTKSHLIFLHGALGSCKQWDKFLQPFEEFFIIHNFNFPGHGNATNVLEEYHYETLSDSVENYITNNKIQTFSIIGYSLGGYIGLNVALRNIPGFRLLITLAAKLKWNKAIAAKECLKLTPEKLDPILTKLKNEHGAKFSELLKNTQSILESIGNAPLRKEQFTEIQTQVILMRGSNDKMVSEEETSDFASESEQFKIFLLHEQPHNIDKMNADLISSLFVSLLKQYLYDPFKDSE